MTITMTMTEFAHTRVIKPLRVFSSLASPSSVATRDSPSKLDLSSRCSTFARLQKSVRTSAMLKQVWHCTRFGVGSRFAQHSKLI